MSDINFFASIITIQNKSSRLYTVFDVVWLADVCALKAYQAEIFTTL